MKSVGSEKLRAWWKTVQYGQRFKVCVDMDLHPQTIHRIASGTNPPDVLAAIRIERCTNGAVRVYDWALPVENTESV